MSNGIPRRTKLVDLKKEVIFGGNSFFLFFRGCLSDSSGRFANHCWDFVTRVIFLRGAEAAFCARGGVECQPLL